jgi:fructosamine-3-kinase
MDDLIQQIGLTTGNNLTHHRLTPVNGGDINSAYQLQTAELNWFIKLNRADLLDMFIAEAEGLQALAATNTVQVPQVISVGSHQRYAYLILNFIPLKALRGQSAITFAQQLAQLHHQQRQAYFGWHRDNTIGSMPQSNQRHQDWPSFWQQQRLGKQLQLAADNGYLGNLQKQGEKLCQQLPAFFKNYQPQPALLHGDLWAGNVAADTQGQPVLFDPACYFGDRETDLAMTELFGGFNADFYAAYNAAYPLDTGYKTRKNLYNLYHILNHLNLFGTGYLQQAQQMINQLLSELG